MAGYVPRSWKDLQILGNLLSAKGRDKNDKKLDQDPHTSAAQAFLDHINNETYEKRVQIVENICKRQFGVLGLLGLCKMEDVRHPSTLLMAAAHVLLIEVSREELDLVLTCTGNEINQTPEWNHEVNWPELFPDGWNKGVDEKSFSFCYKVSQLPNCDDHDAIKRTGNVHILIKGIQMGSNMFVLNGVVVDSENSDRLHKKDWSPNLQPPVTCGLNISDFVAMSKNCEGGVPLLANENDSVGLCGIITRASALQLSITIKRQILHPLLSEYTVAKSPEVSLSPKKKSSESAQQKIIIDDPTGQWGSTYPVGGPASNYGSSDLFPNLNIFPPYGGGVSGGGMHFGPNNPFFDQRFEDIRGRGPSRGPSRLPPGVPPGARFDPFCAPGIGEGRGGFGRSQRYGRGNTGGGGEPNPDHLPPPGMDDYYL